MKCQTTDVLLEAEEFGSPSDPTLILIRGLGSQLVHWPAALIDGFVSQGFRVIIFDNRDVGKSQRCASPSIDADADTILRDFRNGAELVASYSLEEMADDVAGLMDAFALAKAHIFGISMGGAIAQIFAARHPFRALSLVSVMSSARPLSDRGLIEEKFRWLLSWPMTEKEAEEAWVRGHREYGSPGYPMNEDDIRDEARVAYRRDADPAGVNRQFLASYVAKDRREMLKSVTCPTLVIHGAEDPLTPPSLGREVADHVPGAEFCEIPGMGHIITPALAPLIVARVAKFVRR